MSTYVLLSFTVLRRHWANTCNHVSDNQFCLRLLLWVKQDLKKSYTWWVEPFSTQYTNIDIFWRCSRSVISAYLSKQLCIWMIHFKRKTFQVSYFPSNGNYTSKQNRAKDIHKSYIFSDEKAYLLTATPVGEAGRELLQGRTRGIHPVPRFVDKDIMVYSCLQSCNDIKQ